MATRGGRRTSRAKKRSASPSYCEICGYSVASIIQRHRITPGREGGRYNLGNVITLCPNHHHEAEQELISRDELHTIVQARISLDRQAQDQ